MDIYFLQYKFNSVYLPLLLQDSNERNKKFNHFYINDIYDLIYLSSGAYGLFARNNSLKLLNKYIIYINQTKKYNIYHIEHIYHFLINYDFINKKNIQILEEMNHQINIYVNQENFKNYIYHDKEIKNILNHLCK